MIKYLLLFIGLLFLVKGADLLIDGSASLAKKFRISSLVIGLTIVALGTSMPELVVNIFAAVDNAPEVSFGNIIGSNISNTLLILGICAVIHQIKVQSSTVWKEIPFSLLAAVVLFVLSNKTIINQKASSSLTRTDGLILLFFLGVFFYYIFELIKKGKYGKDIKVEIKKYSTVRIVFMILLGSTLLYFGGEWVVEGAVFAAAQFGFSQILISSTIIAIGTSLPELVTSIIASLKNEGDLIMGDIVGSNIFNIFLIMAIPPLITPTAIPVYINPDFMFLIFSSLLLFFFMFMGRRHVLERWKGVVFIGIYAAYIVFLLIRG